MKKNKTIINMVLLISACCMSLSSFIASANNDTWEHSASAYLWGAGVNGKQQNGTDIDTNFGDIIRELDFALMGSYEARKNKWSFVGDLIYMDIGADEGATLPNGTVKVDLQLKGLVITMLGGYNVSHSKKNTTDFVFGARYFDLDVGLDLTGNNNAIGASGSETVFDAVIGVRGQLALNENWFMPYHLDVGTGQSDSTYQIIGGIGYKYKWGDLKLVYRHMEWNMDSDSSIADINFSGPVLGAAFHF